MDERVAKTISQIADVDGLLQFEKNAKERDRLTSEIAEAIAERSREILREYVGRETNLIFLDLTPAEEKIVDVVCDYILLKKRDRRNATYTLRQIANRGLIGAAEQSVSQLSPTQGLQTLEDESRVDLTYERVIVDHPDEFSPRAIWFARKALEMPNDAGRAPVDAAGKVQSRTEALISWLRSRAERGGGHIAPYTNAEAAEAMALGDIQRYGRVHGNIQSRLDYACFLTGLPPLGLTASEPFAEAWGQQERNWEFPKDSMQSAARSHVWSATDFQKILSETEKLPGQAHFLWRKALSDDEITARAWAFGFIANNVQQNPDVQIELEEVQEEAPTKRNPPWSRDELILALDLYLKNRASPPGKDSKKVIELSVFLNRLGSVLRKFESETFRNENGVYMKMMNFRRFDAEFTDSGKVGLQRGNKDEVIVWKEFSGDLEKLNAVVNAIRAAIDHPADDDDLSGADEPEVTEASEGRILTRLHRVRERSRKLVDQKRRQAMEAHGKLACEVCGFEFAQKYGPDSVGIIDCHHTRPVHTLTDGDRTRLTDLALLCANCHRVIHSTRPWLSLDALRARLNSE